MSDPKDEMNSGGLSGPPMADIKRECDEDDPRDNGEESKVRLKTAVVYCEKLLLEDNHTATKPSAVIKKEVVLPPDDLIAWEEHDEAGMFEEVGGSLSESDPDYVPDEKKSRTDAGYIPLEYKMKVVKMAKEHPRWSLKSLQSKGGSRLKRMDDLKAWEEQIRNGGTTMDKYNTIDSRTYDRFVEARRSGQQVTTKDLQEWAKAAASTFPNFEFRASKQWIKVFKRKHRIRQRKVTKAVFKENTVTLEESVDDNVQKKV